MRPTVTFIATLAVLATTACRDDAAPFRPSAGPRTKTVVVISIDTLRPERLGAYGNAPDVSPTIDALAAQAVVFDSALSCAPWTLPSHATMFTGLDPVAHGVVNPNCKLSERAETLAEQLRADGFDTAAFTDGGFCGEDWGFEQGFQTFDGVHSDSEGRTGFARYLDRALDWMRARGDRPYFLFLHTFDVHAPYDRCAPDVLDRFRARPTADRDDDFELYRGTFTHYAQEMHFDQYGRMEEVWNDYDAGVHEADTGVARVLDALRESGRFDDALVVVLSDHGESFYDHDLWIGHGLELTDDELRVPLIVKLPAGEGGGRRIDTLVDLVDLAPTVLDVAGLPPTELMRGSSLRELVRGKPRSRDWVFGGTYTTERYFLVRDGLKYITDIGLPPVNIVRGHIEPSTPPVLQELLPGGEFVKRLGTDENGSERQRVSYYVSNADPLGLFDAMPLFARLYDLGADPRELSDVSAAQPERTAAMRKALEAQLAESMHVSQFLNHDAEAREMSPQQMHQLQALGYAVGGAESDTSDLTKALRELFDSPPELPREVERLREVDRRIHRVRLAVRDGRQLGPDDLLELRAAADAAVAWLEELRQRQFHYRVRWRILEIEKLCKDNGLEFDPGPYTLRINRAVFRGRDARGDGADDESSASPPPRQGARKGQRRKKDGVPGSAGGQDDPSDG